MKSKQNRYTTEIHVGLLVLIIIFLGLNFSSNWIIYKNKAYKHDQVLSELNSKAVAISRNYKSEISPQLSAEQIEKFKIVYNLSDLISIPASPEPGYKLNKREWFITIAHKIPTADLPKIAGKFIHGEFDDITRGEGKEYYFLYPFSIKHENKLLIVSDSYPDLAYIDDATTKQFMLSIITLIVTIIIYVVLYRYILAPFKTLREEAETAGRIIESDSDEVSSLVEDYRKIIDELRLKEKELRVYNAQITDKADSLELYNNYLLRSINVGVLTIDLHGKIVECNRKFQEFIYEDPENIKDTQLKSLNLFPLDVLDLIYDVIEVESTVPYMETEILLDKGESKNIGLTISPIYNNKNIQIGISILCTDITELKKLRDELETKHELAMLGEMSAGLAHQLRNSLGAIKGYNSLIKRKLQNSKDPQGALSQLEVELYESECLITKFLDYSKPFDFNPDQFKAERLLTGIIDSVKNRSSFESLVISFENNLPDNVSVTIDKVLFKQAVINLLENSVKANRENSNSIILSSSIQDGCFIVSVKDYGVGIEKEYQEKIFTPFFTTDPSGTGLGLSLVKKIIALHGGKIELRSDINCGAEFIISVPLVYTPEKLQETDTGRVKL